MVTSQQQDSYHNRIYTIWNYLDLIQRQEPRICTPTLQLRMEYLEGYINGMDDK